MMMLMLMLLLLLLLLQLCVHGVEGVLTACCRCVLELYSCASSGGRFQVAMTPKERDRFAREMRLDPYAFNRMLSKVNTRSAQCSREEDRVRYFLLPFSSRCCCCRRHRCRH